MWKITFSFSLVQCASHPCHKLTYRYRCCCCCCSCCKYDMPHNGITCTGLRSSVRSFVRHGFVSFAYIINLCDDWLSLFDLIARTGIRNTGSILQVPQSYCVLRADSLLDFHLLLLSPRTELHLNKPHGIRGISNSFCVSV